ncbi:hypothetical protein PLESTB_001509600 [Pleodorina starrii]|uniref:Uncharacterized protein n=1 Tax=Pleodorina starrii TaxID=330485 RepID=A0A9W6F8J1_9CHLO|nr:hypothetical protein PLESTB_001509600 [Pleodorina starrii]
MSGTSSAEGDAAETAGRAGPSSSPPSPTPPPSSSPSPSATSAAAQASPSLPAALQHTDLPARSRLHMMLGQAGALSLRAACRQAKTHVDASITAAWVDAPGRAAAAAAATGPSEAAASAAACGEAAAAASIAFAGEGGAGEGVADAAASTALASAAVGSAAACSSSPSDASGRWWREQWPARAPPLLRALRCWPRCTILVLRAEGGGAELLRPFAEAAAAAAAGGGSSAAAVSCPHVTSLKLYGVPASYDDCAGKASVANGGAALPPASEAAAAASAPLTRQCVAELTPAYADALGRLFPNLEVLVIRGEWRQAHDPPGSLTHDGGQRAARSAAWGGKDNGFGAEAVRRLMVVLSSPSFRSPPEGRFCAGGGRLRRLELPSGLLPGVHIAPLTQLQHLRLTLLPLPPPVNDHNGFRQYGTLLAGLPSLVQLRSLVLAGGAERPSRELLAALPRSLERLRMEAAAPQLPPRGGGGRWGRGAAAVAAWEVKDPGGSGDGAGGGDDDDGNGGGDGDDCPVWQYDFVHGHLRLLRFITVADLLRSWKPLAEHVEAVGAPAIAHVDVQRLVLILADMSALFRSPDEILGDLLRLLTPPSGSKTATEAPHVIQAPSAETAAPPSPSPPPPSPPSPPPLPQPPPPLLHLRRFFVLGRAKGAAAALRRLLGTGAVQIGMLTVLRQDGVMGGFDVGGVFGGAAAAADAAVGAAGAAAPGQASTLPSLLRTMGHVTPRHCLPRKLWLEDGVVALMEDDGGGEYGTAAESQATAAATATASVSAPEAADQASAAVPGGGDAAASLFAPSLAQALSTWPQLHSVVLDRMWENPKAVAMPAAAAAAAAPPPAAAEAPAAAAAAAAILPALPPGGGGAPAAASPPHVYGTPRHCVQLLRLLVGRLDDAERSPSGKCFVVMNVEGPRLEVRMREEVGRLMPQATFAWYGSDGEFHATVPYIAAGGGGGSGDSEEEDGGDADGSGEAVEGRKASGDGARGAVGGQDSGLQGGRLLEPLPLRQSMPHLLLLLLLLLSPPLLLLLPLLLPLALVLLPPLLLLMLMLTLLTVTWVGRAWKLAWKWSAPSAALVRVGRPAAASAATHGSVAASATHGSAAAAARGPRSQCNGAGGCKAVAAAAAAAAGKDDKERVGPRALYGYKKSYAGKEELVVFLDDREI